MGAPMKALLLLLPICLLAGCVETEAPASPQPQADTCHASRFQGLLGQPRAVLDSMKLPPATRVIGPNDAVTMDFRTDRLNFEIDSNAVIAKIGCY